MFKHQKNRKDKAQNPFFPIRIFYADGRNLAYVKASIASGSVRGFVDPNCISFDK